MNDLEQSDLLYCDHGPGRTFVLVVVALAVLVLTAAGLLVS